MWREINEMYERVMVQLDGEERDRQLGELMTNM